MPQAAGRRPARGSRAARRCAACVALVGPCARLRSRGGAGRRQELLQHYADAWDVFAGGSGAAAGASAAPSAEGNALFAALPEEARTLLWDRPLPAPDTKVQLT
jgi:hypothetical protein